jgi:hypothetical protein
VAAATWAGATNNLNTAVGNRVQKSGDTMTGILTVNNNISISGDLQFSDATSGDAYLAVDSGRILRWRSWNGGSPNWDVVEFETGNGTFHGAVTGVSFSGNGAGLTNIPINYGSGTQNLYTVSVSNLLSFPACGRTVNLIVTGSGLTPNVCGVYTQQANWLGNSAWHSTNSFYIYYIPDSFPIWTISSNLWNNYSEWAGDHYMFYNQPADLGSPAGAYMAVNDSVGAPVVSYSITYNPAAASKMTLGSVSPTSSVVELRYNNSPNDALVRFGDSNVFFRPVIVKDSLQASSLQITGGSPTNGAVWLVTNVLGEGKWSFPVGFSGTLASDFIFTNATARNVEWGNKTEIGNNFDGTTFVAPVNGIYSFVFRGLYRNQTGSLADEYVGFWILKNSVKITDGWMVRPGTVTSAGGGEVSIVSVYLTNGSPIKCQVQGITKTNKLDSASGACYFSGTLTKEIP